MGYIDSTLTPGERVLQQGHLHWIVYASAVLFAFLGVGFVVIGNLTNEHPLGVFAELCGALLILAAVVRWLDAWIKRLTTEIAATTRRFIVKQGLVRPR
jgi:hypothetical protein